MKEIVLKIINEYLNKYPEEKERQKQLIEYLQKYNNSQIVDEEVVPIDIDTHIIPFDIKRNLPEHYHFDFCYLFVVEKIDKIEIAEEEIQNYKLVDINQLYNNEHYSKIMFKVEQIIKNIN